MATFIKKCASDLQICVQWEQRDPYVSTVNYVDKIRLGSSCEGRISKLECIHPTYVAVVGPKYRRAEML